MAPIEWETHDLAADNGGPTAFRNPGLNFSGAALIWRAKSRAARAGYDKDLKS